MALLTSNSDISQSYHVLLFAFSVITASEMVGRKSVLLFGCLVVHKNQKQI